MKETPESTPVLLQIASVIALYWDILIRVNPVGLGNQMIQMETDGYETNYRWQEMII